MAGGTPAKEDALHVMLQGSSAQEVRELVETSGGAITHDLHIINAVGAKLTDSQLDEVLKSPLITRTIDDLSAPDRRGAQPHQQDDACDVSGSLEIDYDTKGFDWKLYNKKPTPVSLQRLELSWPEALGPIKSISLGDKSILLPLFRDKGNGSLDLQLDPAHSTALTDIAALRIRFNTPASLPADFPLRQRDFTVKASFIGKCSTELIPGYQNNHENFYYADVVGASDLHLHGVTGKGVTVAVLDSGLWEHEALVQDTSGKRRVIARYNAITNSTGEVVFDESGHGTHMTSVIAHSGIVSHLGEPTGTFKGIAPDINLIAVKAFDVEGQGGLMDIVRGVQWVVDNRETYDIRVLNLSFAARPRWPYWLDPVNQAIIRAWDNGIVVVAAAGNEGPEPMSIGSPGNLPYIITVGAVTDSWTSETRDDDYIPDFSSRGPTPDAHIKPDIVAPGGHITGITRPGSSLTQEHPEYMLRTGEFVMTGSSQASALVSGIVALLLQLEPDLSPDDVKCKLISSADPAINRDGLLAYSPFQQGHGYASATRAVTLGQKGCGNPDMEIRLEIDNQEHFRGPATVEEDGSVSLPGLGEMLSPDPRAKGLSQIRKWGVKAHIERDDLPASTNSSAEPPFDWRQMYLEEKAKIEALARETPE
jgi:subtilisin family serine protease